MLYFLSYIILSIVFIKCRTLLPQGFRLYKSNFRKLSTVFNNENYIENSLVNKIIIESERSEKLNFEQIFNVFATDEIFINSIWQKKPFLCNEELPNLKNAYLSSDLKADVDGDFIEAGRGTFEEGRTGWNMKTVSKPRGKTFEEAKLRFEDIEIALKERSGTVVVNSAGGFIPRMASVCLNAVNAFELPAALNMYVTNPGQRVSAPPHTDKQDVFVLQSQGQKRWRVYSPPPPNRMSKADPLARGKGTDILDFAELTAPLIDVVLYPGHVLYVPAGFPHTTDTVSGSTGDSAVPSLHMTLGVDTHIWGLNYAALRTYALRMAGLSDKLLLTKLEPSVYWELQSTLPFGFLGSSRKDTGDEISSQDLADIIHRSLSLLRTAEPTRWSSDTVSDATLTQLLHLEDVVRRLAGHSRGLTDTFRAMYADVAFKISEARMDLSFFRSQPYFVALEEQMLALDKWSQPKPSISSIQSNENSVNNKRSGSKSKGFGSK